LESNLSLVRQNPERLLLPEQLDKITKYMDQRLAIAPESQNKGMTLGESIGVADSAAILKELSLPQKLQLLEWYYKRAQDSQDPIAQDRSYGLAKAFISTGLVGKENVLAIAKGYGRDAELVSTQPATDEPPTSAANKGLDAIHVGSILDNNARLSGLAGTYFAGLTAIVNLALYVGDSFQKGGPGDNRYLALASVAGGAGLYALNKTTAKTANSKGIVETWVDGLAKGQEASTKTKKEMQEATNRTVYASQDTQAFYTNANTISSLAEIITAMDLEKNTDKSVAAKAAGLGVGKETMGGRMLAKLDVTIPEQKQFAEYIRKNASKPGFNEEMLKVALTYKTFQIKSSKDIVDKFGYDKSIYS